MVSNEFDLVDSRILDIYLENYSFYDFDFKKLVDLSFKEINYNKTSGEFNFSIINLGTADSSFFKVNLYDSELNFSDEFTIDYLLKNQSITFNYNLSKNLSNVYLHLDSNDLIYEKNELNNNYIWFERVKVETYNEKISSNVSSVKFRINESFKDRVFNLSYILDNLVNLEFSNFNGSLNLNKTIEIDFFENKNGFLKLLSVDTNFNFSNSTISFSYNSSLISNVSELKVYYCSDYNFSLKNCKDDFIDITNKSTIDNLTQEISINVEGFSAYAIREGLIVDSVSTNSLARSSSSSSSSGSASSSFAKLNNYTYDNNSVLRESNLTFNSSELVLEVKLEKEFNLSGEVSILEVFFNNLEKLDLEVVSRPNEIYNNKLSGNFLFENSFNYFKVILGFIVVFLIWFFSR
jgi:hypothetical protein